MDFLGDRHDGLGDVIVRIEVVLGHPELLASGNPLLLQERVGVVAHRSPVEVGPENRDIGQGLGIVENLVVIALVVGERLRRNQLGVDGSAVVEDKVVILGRTPVGPIPRVIGFVLDGNGVEIHAIVLEVLHVGVQIIPVIRPLGGIRRILGTGGSRTQPEAAGRIPWSREHDGTLGGSLLGVGKFGRPTRVGPTLPVVADSFLNPHAQDAESQIAVK